MDDEDVKLEEAYGPLPEPKLKLEPLFIEEEDEDYFEDCLEEMEAVFALPQQTIAYSQKCREAMQAEFNGLMMQMLAQLDDFDAAHEIKSTPPVFFAETEHMSASNGFKDTSKYENFVPETAVVMAEDESEGCNEEEPEFSSAMMIKELGTSFESCIEEVNQLEQRKEELVQELLELEKPMAAEVQALRNELKNAKNLLSKARIERQSLQEEMRVVKRRLFFAARDCAQSQVALATQQKHVEQLNQEQEEMKTYVEKLTEDITQLHSEHQENLQALQHQKDNITQESSKDKTRSYLYQGRRASTDLQQYLQDGIKSLEEWYEPRLVALLKIRESSAEALSKSKEQCQELKAQIGPLKDEEQRLGLERARLEERIRLMERQRKENVEQYRGTIDLLEESSRELKTELQIQIKKIKEMETLKNSLVKQLYFYRQRTEGHHTQEILMTQVDS
ncbi:syncoilin [Hoplias malabaricus]|uniref:syncoilin n=1 Tax=Hoplias malabaricus TaxID=27720 RepID=UPI0034636943